MSTRYMNTPGSVIQIGFNKWLLFGKTLILCLFLAITGTFIFIHPLVQFETILLSLALLFICFLFLLIIIAIELVFFPKGVRIDHEDHSL
ncbi:MAG TPA: hypothetical protein VMI35_09545, partial [Puia sp.]|nr:hypothetical protein [Puia sp.]